MSDSLPKPNILLITTDTQRTDTLRCMGSAFAHSPNISPEIFFCVCATIISAQYMRFLIRIYQNNRSHLFGLSNRPV